MPNDVYVMYCVLEGISR